MSAVLLAALAEASLRATPLLAAAVAWAVLRARGAPAVRHVVLLTALGAAVLMPLLATVLPTWELPWPDLGPVGVAAGAAPAPGVAGGAGAVVATGATGATGAPSAVALAVLWLAGLWLAGTVILGARLGWGLVGLARLRRAALADGRVRRLGGRVRLVTTPAVSGPAVLAGWRPLVLLPPAADGWSRRERRAVVAHELAHLRRGDPWALVLASVATALHWPNPLVWIAARRLRLAGEEACDRAAVVAGIEPWRYADLLLRLTRDGARPAGHRLAPAAAGPGLSRRVEALLAGVVPEAAPGRGHLALAGAFGLVLALAVAAAQPAPASPGNATGSAQVVAARAPSSPLVQSPPASPGPGTGSAQADTGRPETGHPEIGDPGEGVGPREYAVRYGIDHHLAADILAAAAREGVEAPLAFGLVRVESGFDPDATSPRGAVGLTQILPSSAAAVEPAVSPRDLRDPPTNLRLGFRLLRGYMDRFEGDRERGLLAYSVGPRRVAAPGPPPASDYPRRVAEAAALAPTPR